MVSLGRDGSLLFLTRFLRMFSYGMLSVALFEYLTELGFDAFRIGAIVTLTLLGDLIVTFYLTTTADAFGRKKTMIIGAVLKLFAGIMFSFFANFWILVLSGIIGVLTPTGGEIGPFLACEQAGLTEIIPDKDDFTKVFGWYNLVAYVAQALGALSGGLLISALLSAGQPPVEAYRACIIFYAVFGLIKALLYMLLSPKIEPTAKAATEARGRTWFGKFGLHRPESRAIIAKLSALFVLDSFAGGFVMQTLIVYWFSVRYGMDPSTLGAMMMGANVLSGISALVATPMVKRFGAIHTMVFTHFPSNILLLLVPLMPTKTSAVVMLLLRFSISQMDVPARQSYVAVVVAPDERSAAGGITNIVRSVGLSVSPLLAGYLIADPNQTVAFDSPWVISGGLKCIYDVLLYLSFRFASADGSTTKAAETSAKQAQSQQEKQKLVQDSSTELEELEKELAAHDGKTNAAGVGLALAVNADSRNSLGSARENNTPIDERYVIEDPEEQPAPAPGRGGPRG